jgi:hypothetical protein
MVVEFFRCKALVDIANDPGAAQYYFPWLPWRRASRHRQAQAHCQLQRNTPSEDILSSPEQADKRFVQGNCFRNVVWRGNRNTELQGALHSGPNFPSPSLPSELSNVNSLQHIDEPWLMPSGSHEAAHKGRRETTCVPEMAAGCFGSSFIALH